MNKFLLVGLLILLYLPLSAQNNYRSVASGTWSDPAIWEEETSPGIWATPAPGGAPDSGDGSILISTGHVVNVSTSTAADGIIIEYFSQLVIDEGVTFTLANGIGNDISINDDGLDFGTLLVNGILDVANGANINNANSSNVSINGTYRNNDSAANSGILLATWSSSSTCEIRGVTNVSTVFANLNQSFGNFVYDCPSQTSTVVDFNGGLGNTTIQGNFIVRNTGDSFSSLRIIGTTSNNDLTISGNLEILNASRFIIASGTGGSNFIRILRSFIYSSSGGSVFTTGGSLTLNVGQDFIKSGSSTLNLSSGSGITTINIGRNLIHSAGVITESGPGLLSMINFNGTGSYTGGGTFSNQVNFNIGAGGDLSLGTYSLGGGGNFNLSTGGVLRIGSINPAGALIGNIVNSGSRAYNSGSTIVFNGVAPQYLGSTFPPNVNLTIDNLSGVNLNNSLTIAANRILSLTNGSLIVSANTLTLDGIVSVGSGDLSTNNNSNLIINGTGALGTIPFSPGSSLNNFTLNRTSGGTATLGSDFTIVGVLDLVNGDFVINDRNLTLSGTMGSNSGFVSGNFNTNLNIIGTGPFGEMNFNESSGNSIGSLTLDRSSGSFIVGTSLLINNALNLTNGTLSKDDGEVFTMASNSTINRRGTGLVDFKPAASSTYNVNYLGATALTTDLELPTSLDGTLNNLTINSSNTITLNSEIDVNGDLTILSGTLSSSNSSYNVAVGGNFTNAGTYNPNTNTTTYNGAINQTVARAAYHNLVINGAGLKALEGNASVSSTGILTLSSGTLNLNSSTLTLNNPAATAIVRTGGSVRSETAGSYGLLAWNIGTTTGTYTYPFISSGGESIPLVFSKPSSGDIGTLSVATFPTDANLTILPNGVTSASNPESAIKRFWQIDKTGPAGTVDVTFSYASNEAPDAPPTGIFKMQRWSTASGQWDAALPGQTSNIIARTITVPGISSFSPWGANDEQTPFPVDLRSFNAKLIQDYVQLDWVTLTETKSSHFVIERSRDSHSFDSIGTVLSAGNSSERLEYDFADLTATDILAKVLYYRLKQVDVDGQSKTYPMVGVDVENIIRNSKIKIFPNPATVDVTVASYLKEDVQLDIYNPLGKIVDKKKISSGKTTVDTSNLEQGVYVFKFINGSTVINKKVIIK